MNTKDITIIIPTLNRPSLVDAVQSVLNQSDEHWKLIVVGDGVKPTVTSDDPRIKWFEDKKHGSAGEIRNVGIHLARTEWVGFLDDDDVLMEDYVKQWCFQHKDHEMLIYQMMNRNNVTGGHFPISVFQDVKYGNIGMNFAIKKKHIIEVGGFEAEYPGFNEDWALIEKVTKNVEPFWLDYLGYYVRPKES